MKDTELKRMRDRALYETYLRGLEDGAFTSLGEAIDYVLAQKAPQYFIEAKQVSCYFGMIESYVSLIALNSASRRRVWKLYDEYLKWRAANPDSTLTRERVCELLVEEPAPEFYLGPTSVRHIIQRMRKERVAERARRLVR